MPTFEQMQAGYNALWNKCEITAAAQPAVNRIVARILANKDQYRSAQARTGVPWYFIACLHSREADLNFGTYLGNGDPLHSVTYHVPRGRGPFATWSDGAADALALDGLTRIKDWSIARILYSAEIFNGVGYQRLGENSPYVWAGTNLQQRGKYVADGRFDPSAWDTQMGVAAILKGLVAADASVREAIGKAPTPSKAPPVIVGGSAATAAAGASLLQSHPVMGWGLIVLAVLIGAITIYLRRKGHV